MKVLTSVLAGICRALLSWLLLWTFVFLLLRILSPDPVTIIAGFYTDQVTRQFLEREFGVEGPVAAYLDRLSRVLLLDLGTSWRSGRSVGDLLAGPVRLSMSLTAISTSIALSVGALSFIIVATCRRKTVLGSVISGAATAVSTMPGFLLAILVARSSLPTALGFPAHGVDHEAFTRSLIFPSLCIALPVSAYGVLRMLECHRSISRSSWLRGSLAAGGSWLPSILRGGWPFAATELLDIAFHASLLSLTGAVAVEVVLGLPGLGVTMLDAIGLRDDPVILAIVALVGVFTIVLGCIRDIGQSLLTRSI